MSYECKLCGLQSSTPINFTRHLKSVHQLNNEEYYNKCLKTDETEGTCKICGKPTKFYGFKKGYADCCGISCSNKYLAQNAEHAEIECKICNEIIASEHGKSMASSKFTNHLKNTHNLEVKEYYDQYIKDEKDGICAQCGKETEFRSLLIGYNEFCSLGCAQLHHKTDKESFISRVMRARSIREAMVNMATAISEKYKNFIKNDKLTNASDVRSNPIQQKLIKDVKLVDTLDAKNVPVKTEIAVQSAQNDWIGTQDYLPKKESCGRDYKSRFVDDFNDEQGFSSNEWC